MKLGKVFILVGTDPVDEFMEGNIDSVTSEDGALLEYDPNNYATLKQLIGQILYDYDGYGNWAFLSEDEFNILKPKFSNV